MRIVEGVSGRRADAHAAAAALRLRPHHPVDPSAAAPTWPRSPVRTPSGCTASVPLPNSDDARRPPSSPCRAGQRSPSCSPTRPPTSRHPRRSTPSARCADTERVLVGLDRPLRPTTGAGRRSRPPLADHAQGAHLRAHRRHRGRRDHLAARTARRAPQLGLPVLLAARRHLHPAGAAGHRVRRRGTGLAGMAGARGRRRPGRAADHVRARRHPPAARADLPWLAGYEGAGTGADRQRRRRPVPARRLGRGPRRAAPAPGGRAAGRGDVGLGPAARRCWTTWRATGTSPTTASGRSAAHGGTSSTPRSWPGPASTVRSTPSSTTACPARRPVARAARRDPRRGLRARLRHRAQHLHPVLRLRPAWTPRCC